MKPSIQLIFFGSGPVAADSLAFLAENFTVEGVVSKAALPSHKSLPPVEDAAVKMGLPLYFANNRKELDVLLKRQNVKSDVGVIVDYGVIVSEQAISAFKMGIINSHFSLLPQWRGADPITFAILSGQPNTGVSLMKIVPALDEGELLSQEKLAITSEMTTPELTEKLVELSNSMLVRDLPRYLAGELKTTEQPQDGVSYSRKLTKQDGAVDWHKPAVEIEREIRAFLTWPKSTARLFGQDVILCKAKLAAGSGQPGQTFSHPDGIGVFTGKGSLIITRLKPAGRQEMAAADFLRGHVR